MTAQRLETILIIGGGVAALRAAERLVERGYTGRIEIVAGEAHVPYHRPRLTEFVVAGRGSPGELRLRAQLQGRTRWHHGLRAVGIDRTRRRVLLSNGSWSAYDGLIIATGLTPRTLPGARRSTDRTMVLRTVGDALRLREASRRARSILVIGGGLIGTEAAAVLRAAGTRVTVIDVADNLLRHAVGPQVGAAITALHRRRGVHVETGVAVRAWEHSRRGVRALLADGRALDADAALVATGAWPDVGWLEGVGLDIGDGVLCGPTTHVVGAEDIVACGDCARWPNLRFDAAPQRVEQWATAIAMARHAADSLLDGPDAARPFTPVPWGWTEQWGVRIQMLGRPLGGSPVTLDGAPHRLRGAIGAQDATGRLVGAVVAERPALSLRLHRAIGTVCPRPATGTAWEPPAPTPRPRHARDDDPRPASSQGPRIERRGAASEPPRHIPEPVRMPA